MNIHPICQIDSIPTARNHPDDNPYCTETEISQFTEWERQYSVATGREPYTIWGPRHCGNTAVHAWHQWESPRGREWCRANGHMIPAHVIAAGKAATS